MPLFSIVIPTRNRARLLRYALETALQQTFHDYEIVISDNHSSDDTPAVVHEVGGSRIRYIRPERPLSMAAHWEFALAETRGEYVTYLCDDDAIAPRALEKVESVVRRRGLPIVMWGGASYYDDSWYDAESRNTLVIPTYTGRVIEMDSAATLRDIYGLRGGRLPILVNSVCHRDLIAIVKRKAGRFFVGVSPDFGAGIATVSRVPKYMFIDEILSIGGATSDSTGMTVRHNRGDVFRRLVEEAGDDGELRRVPLRIDVQTTYIVEQFLLLQEVFSEELAGYRINWAQFFLNCHDELDIYARHGVDVEANWLEFFRVLSEQPEQVQAEVRARLSGRHIVPSSPKRIRTLSLDIKNIADCARYVDRRSRRTVKGVVKSLIVAALGGRGFRLARSLGHVLERRCGPAS